MEKSMSQLNLAGQQQGGVEGATGYKTSENQYELTCERCGRRFYVNEKTFSVINSAMQAELDIPIRCYECDEEHDNLSYED